MAKYGIVSADKLNLREGPNTSARVLTQLARGTVLDILKDTGFDWLQVRVDGGTAQGFVSKFYVVLSDSKPVVANTGSVTDSNPPTSTPAPASLGRCEVKPQSLNVRAGPGTSFEILLTVNQGTVFNVISIQGDWIKVRVGTGEGYVAAQYVDLTTTKPSTGFLIEQEDLLTLDLVPARLIPTQAANASAAAVARAWNSYGGLIGKLAALLKIPTSTVVAVVAAESGGSGFGPEGRLIIRFENHLFYQYWGQQHQDTFNRFFAFDMSSPANAWKGHLWRRDDRSPWLSFHGNQDLEWQVLTTARALDDTAALFSVSMGASQVVGFNYRRVGYDTVQRMFYQFARSAPAQIIALFDYVKGMNPSSPAILALQRRDYLTFANIYNGPGNARTYADIIQRYSDLYDQLIRTATPRTR
jgi:uncharacterized protein YraI